MLPGQPAIVGLQLMLLFGSNGPPTHEAVNRHEPAHFASAGPKGGHDGSPGLSAQVFAVRGGDGGEELSSQIGLVSHCGSLHLGSAGPEGGHVGSAGLSVHKSAGSGRLSEAGSNVSEVPGKLLAPNAKPTSTAPAPATLATTPIE